MKTILSLLAASATASKSPWLTDFDGMLAQVGCAAGPKLCGATNFFSTGGEECGPKRGCFSPTYFDHESCSDVAQWQCFRECPAGQALDPLRYCKCIDEDVIYDMFCAPSRGLDGDPCTSDDQCKSEVCSAGECFTPPIVGGGFDISRPGGGMIIVGPGGENPNTLPPIVGPGG